MSQNDAPAYQPDSHRHKKSDVTANTNYKYQAHLVSQDFNPLKTTLGNDDTTERDESQIYSNQGRPKQVRLAQK